MGKSILSVGQCGMDGPRMTRFLSERLGAKVVAAADADEAADRLGQEDFDLVLVNRVFDQDGDSGLDLIRKLKADGAKTPVMLVSDEEGAQQEALALGAKPGFGKANLESDATANAVKAALGDAGS